MTIASKIKKTAAIAVLATLSFGGAKLATAAPGPNGFDPEKKGSITIHKYFGDETDTPANGKAMRVDGKEPLSGVKFKVQKVTKVNLATNEGWVTAGKIAKGEEVEGDLETPGTEKATGATGEANFTDLAVGLYKVTETDTSEAKKNNTDKVNVKKSAPFYITVPMTDPDNRNSWMYDLHVYPKNQDFTVKKKGELVAGSSMRYTVTSTLPALANGKSYDKYNLIDQLSKNHDLASFTVVKVEAISDDSDPAATEIPSANYKVDKETYKSADRVLVKMESAGLEALKTASGKGKKLVRYTYTVNLKNEFKQGDLTNTAYVAPSSDYSDVPEKGKTPGGESTSKFVYFQIQKQDGNNTATKLPDAAFTLYGCTDDGKFIHAVTGAETKTLTEAINLGDVTTSGPDGKTAVVRMPVTGDTSNIKKVCAVETKAPAGYSKLTQPVVFSISPSGEVGKTEGNPVLQTVDNVKNNAGFKMPLTGSQSLILLSVAGVVLMGGAIFFTVRSRKES